MSGICLRKCTTLFLTFSSNCHLLHVSVEAVKVLVELGANVNAQNNLTGASPLHMVAQSHKATITSRIEVAEILINAGAICAQTDKYGSMPINLLEAATEGSEIDEKTKLLLTKLRPNQPVIHEAVIDRDLSLLEKLLSDETRDVNETFQNATPLSLAIRTFLEDITKSSTEANNMHKSSELILDMIRILLRRGADPNCLIVENSTGALEDSFKEPALHKLACALREMFRTRQHIELAERKIEMLQNVVDLLIKSGSNVPQDTIFLLHQAARLNECLFATFLLDRMHVDPNNKGRQGMTPLHFAARSGKLEMLVSAISIFFYYSYSFDSLLYFIVDIAFE
jgi:ankyrin repeat protein